MPMFETELSLARFQYLRGHSTLPLAVLVELGLAVGREVLGTTSVTLADVVQHRAVAVAESITLRVVVEEDTQRFSIETLSGGAVMRHVTGRLERAPASVSPSRAQRTIPFHAEDASVDGYNVHPTIIQAAFATFGDVQRIGKLTFFAPAGARASIDVHADVSFDVIAGDGTLAARFEGIESNATIVEIPAAPVMPTGVSEATEDDVRAFVIEKLATAIGVGEDEVETDVPLLELGVDSISGMSILGAIKTRFGAKLNVAKLMEGATASDLVSFVLEKLSATAPRIPAPRESGIVLNASSAPALCVVRRGPLSSAQHSFALSEQLEAGTPVNNIAVALRAEGELDIAALEHAVNLVIERHEALRTTFANVDGQIVAEVAAKGEIRIATQNVAGPAELEQRIAAEARRTFDLERGPLLRMTAFEVNAQEHHLVFVIHHIVSDGWSLGVFMREMAIAYASYRKSTTARLSPVALQFSDYLAAQSAWVESEEAKRELDYWKKALHGAPELIEIPTDRPRAAMRSSRGRNLDVTLGRETTAALKALFRRCSVTPYVGLLAIYQTLLHRYSRQEQIVTGSPIAGRTFDDCEGVIGPCLNMVAMNTDFANDPTFAELCARVRRVAQGAFDHQKLPFGNVVATIAPSRDASYTPIFQTAFVYQNSPLDLRLPGAKLALRTLDPGATHVDLQLMLSETPDGFAGTLGYATDLFDAPTVQRMVRHFVALAEAVVRDAETPVSKLALMDAHEVARIIELCNPTPPRAPDGSCLHEIFEEQVRLRPRAIAVTFQGEHMTYAELDRRANQLAHFLIEHGVGPETRVALCVDRSFELVISVLGILKAGAAYLPIDPAYPVDRVAHMLEDAEVPVLVTESKLHAELPADLARAICLDTEWSAIEKRSSDKPITAVTDANAAYVIFTSGSTGKPKGCVIEHRMVRPLFSEMQPRIGWDHNDVWTLFHSIAFDFTVWEIWGALLHGGRLVVVPLHVARSPQDFHDLLCDEAVTILNQTPSAFRQLDQVDETSPRSKELVLRRVMMGGEAVETKMLKSWWSRHPEDQPQLVTLYGITETSVISTYTHLTRRELSSHARCPIGKSVPGWTHYVLDANRQPVPIGLIGELYIGGSGVGRGYINLDELTRERFLPDPFSDVPGARMYRSSDLVRLLPDGSFDYLGRADTQVKIRGFRIELGEIESALGRHPAIRNALVIARKTSTGESQLVAYVVASSEISPAELKASLTGQLPAYMVPAHIVMLDALPLTPNGKVDRKALPPPAETTTRVVAPARDRIEEILVALWEEALEVRPIGIHDDFFELGGNSLTAMQMSHGIKKAFGVTLPVAALFSGPTIAALADAIRAKQNGEATSASPLVELQRGSERRPPIYFVHPSGGDVFVYQELARALGRDEPFFALRMPTLDDPTCRFTDVESMARMYTASIRAKQPRGPYRVGGWSMGGVVAIEIARQLEEAGEEVTRLTLLDTHLELVRGESNVDRNELARMFVIDLAGLLGADPTTLAERFWTMTIDGQLDVLLATGRDANVFPEAFTKDDLRARMDVFIDNVVAMTKYALPTLRCDVTLIAAEEAMGGVGTAAEHALVGLTVGNLSVRHVPGNHYTIMRAPRVHAVANAMDSDTRVKLSLTG